jgi:hypothetical protein
MSHVVDASQLTSIHIVVVATEFMKQMNIRKKEVQLSCSYSCKSFIKACRSKCKHMKRNQDNENNSNEVENIMLKGHLCHTSINDGGALANVCGRDEDL